MSATPTTPGVPARAPDRSPGGGGEMAERVRSCDWASTPLGPMEGWSPALRAIADLVLASGFPMIALWGPDLIQIYNDGYRDLMGRKHPAGLGQPTRECWPEVWHINEPIYRRVLEGETLTFEDNLYPIARNGTLEDAWFTLSYSPLRDESERVAGVLVTAFDTTERLRADTQLRESEERIRRLLDIGTVGIIFFNPDGGITGANDAFLRMGGYAREDLEAGRLRWDELTPPEWMPATERAVAELEATGRTTPYEKEYYRGDGSRWWALFAAASVGDGEGVEFVLDITERKRAEAALREGEARQAFLLRLSDALRPLADPAEIQGEATRLLRERFDVGWCYYIEFDEAVRTGVVLKDAARDGLPSLAGIHDVTDIPQFVDYLQAGHMLNVPAFASSPLWSPRVVEQYSAMGVKSVLGAPLVKRGRLIALLLMVDTDQRDWSDSALTLISDVADRTWAALERARAEAALRDSEERLRGALSIGTVGVMFWGGDFGLTDVNDAFLRMTGFTREEALGKTWQEFTPEEFHPPSLKAVEEVTTLGESTPYEKQYFRKDGSRWWGLFAARRVGGEVVEFVLDVTERCEAEARLRESEEQFRRFGDASSDVLWIRDAQTLRFEYLSPAFEAMYGADRAEVLDNDHVARWAALIYPEDRERALTNIERVRAGERVTQEFRVVRPSDGMVRWLRDTDFPIPDGDGRVTRIAGIAQDVTEWRRTQEERERLLWEAEEARREAEEAVRARDEFLSIASHELRNPLAGIRATAQQLDRAQKSGRLDGARAERYARTIAEGSDRLGLLVGDLLDVSRLRSGQFPVRPEPTDLAQLVREAVAAQRASDGGHRYRVEVADEAMVEVDRARMQQVVANLLDNAVKYSPDGGEVRVLLTRDGDGVRLRVRDHGIGLPEGEAERIFQPFGRATNAASSNIPGMGLGLYICQKIAEAHGGRMWAESEGPGRGTTISLWLPAGRGGDSGERASGAGD